MKHVDAVITWVDGSNPDYQKKIKKNLKVGSYNLKKEYLSANEISLCVGSIIKNAPFIRKIFIVTDSQIPNLDDISSYIPLNKVQIVDHKEIFRGMEEFLPTFNIRSIDALLYRIKGISERFVYFNDDMFIVKKINLEEWFIEDKVVLLGRWAKSYNTSIIKTISHRFFNKFRTRPSYNAAQSMAANIAGFKTKYYKSYHSGRPQIKSIIKEFYEKEPECLRRQINFKFRSNKQYIPYSLCWHLMIKEKIYYESSRKKLVEITKIKDLNPQKLKRILSRIDDEKDVKFLNIQDLNYASNETKAVFKEWLIKKLL